MLFFGTETKHRYFNTVRLELRSAGSRLPESDGDFKQVHHSSLWLVVLSRLISRRFSTKVEVLQWSKLVEIWGAQNDTKNNLN